MLVKSRSVGRSGDRKPQVQVTVDTTVILSQVKKLRPIWDQHFATMVTPKPLLHAADFDTLTLLRHSYICHMLAYGKLSIKDKEELAQDMCHSVETQAQYHFTYSHWFWSQRLNECELTNKRGLSHHQNGSESVTATAPDKQGPSLPRKGVWVMRVRITNKKCLAEVLDNQQP